MLPLKKLLRNCTLLIQAQFGHSLDRYARWNKVKMMITETTIIQAIRIVGLLYKLFPVTLQDYFPNLIRAISIIYRKLSTIKLDGKDQIVKMV